MKKFLIKFLESKFNRYYLAVSIVVFSVCVMSYQNVAFAEDVGVGTTLTAFQTLIFTLIKIVGVIVTGFAAVNLGMSFKNHDPAQRALAIPGILGGLIIIFVKEILSSVGAT